MQHIAYCGTILNPRLTLLIIKMIGYSDTVRIPLLLTVTLFSVPNVVSVTDVDCISDIHSIVEMITKLRPQVSCGQAGSARRAGSAADAQDVQR